MRAVSPKSDRAAEQPKLPQRLLREGWWLVEDRSTNAESGEAVPIWLQPTIQENHHE